ncbi:MAG: hypothetical protein ACE5IH_01680 [Thermodesulfobacteriota bacterium]
MKNRLLVIFLFLLSDNLYALTDTDIAVSQGPGGTSKVRDFDNCGATINTTFPTYAPAINPDSAVRVAKGDITGDGIPEIVGTYGGSLATPANSTVKIFSQTGILLTTFNDWSKAWFTIDRDQVKRVDDFLLRGEI